MPDVFFYSMITPSLHTSKNLLFSCKKKKLNLESVYLQYLNIIMARINVEVSFQRIKSHRGRGELLSFYNGLYGKTPPGRGIVFRLQVYERVGVSLVEVNERVGKSVHIFDL